ncbi:hypothetical protein [Streptomyces achromogenes]|uniref:hypothetical protein n=1 Tax=Streptomyces achromogenes TaxID=67255 RepID=UPI00341721B3
MTVNQPDYRTARAALFNQRWATGDDFATAVDAFEAAVRTAMPAPQSPADRAALRERIAEAVDAVFERWTDGLGGQRPQDAMTDAVLAMLPEPVDWAVVRAETLREAVHMAETLAANMLDVNADRGNGAYDVVDLLRRLAGEQPEPPAAGSSLTPDDWTRFVVSAGQLGGKAADPGACVVEARRIIAAGQQAAGDQAEQDDTLHACPGRWGSPSCRCFDAEPAPPSA